MYNFEHHTAEQIEEILKIYIKVRTFLEKNQYSSYSLKSVNPKYYSLTFEERRDILNAPSTQYLCKTILMENTVYDQTFQGPFYPRYIAVIVQYVTKLNTEKLQKFFREIQNQNSEKKASKSKFHFRLCEEQESYQLSGYEHNAVTPFAMNAAMPLVMSESLQTLGFIWLGGGHMDVKLRIGLDELNRKYNEKVFYADII